MRLLLRSERGFVAPLNVAGQLLCEVQGNTATLVLRDWTPDRLPEIQRQTGAFVEAVPLTLEDIFLVVHS